MFNIRLLSKTNRIVLASTLTRTKYLLFTKLQNGLLLVIPYIVLIPQYFNNKITIGVLMRHSATFDLIVVNATILLSLYPILIAGLASDLRVKEMHE